jgi:hypothetical protein
MCGIPVRSSCPDLIRASIQIRWFLISDGLPGQARQ